jgi:hypothetical protein
MKSARKYLRLLAMAIDPIGEATHGKVAETAKNKAFFHLRHGRSDQQPHWTECELSYRLRSRGTTKRLAG